MKLKQQPEDFRVEELTDATPADVGEFAFYRLDKTGWTTPDALAAIRRRWKIDWRRLSYGGLKDRHAVTSQHLTIARGPKRNLSHERITLTYLGQRSEPFTASNIRANRFTITLRAMSDNAVSLAESALREVADAGLPNYFDDQRFGSVMNLPSLRWGEGSERSERVRGSEPQDNPSRGETPLSSQQGEEFVAKEMVFGRFERALWLALAAPYEFDRADAKREKSTLRELWGKWSECQSKLPKGHARSIVSYLSAHPTDFKGAVARLRPELQGLYLSAYQSYLWNRLLASWMTTTFGPTNLTEVELKLGRVPAPVRVPEEHRALWVSLVLPLPSARLKPEPIAPWMPFLEDVLKAEGLTLAELKIKGLQKPFFSKGDRPACVRPANLSSESAPDELNKGRTKLTLRFDLPRGSYATMLVKRVTIVDATEGRFGEPRPQGRWVTQ
ncbi:MAG: tRNA pseudouridine(13) synthase TruD [Planctomycetia bacterium]|nr:tRNA pseudouridine(13) synthase TruD [Planctomycetia bacterium]